MLNIMKPVFYFGNSEFNVSYEFSYETMAGKRHLFLVRCNPTGDDFVFATNIYGQCPLHGTPLVSNTPPPSQKVPTCPSF